MKRVIEIKPPGLEKKKWMIFCSSLEHSHWTVHTAWKKKNLNWVAVWIEPHVSFSRPWREFSHDPVHTVYLYEHEWSSPTAHILLLIVIFWRRFRNSSRLVLLHDPHPPGLHCNTSRFEKRQFESQPHMRRSHSTCKRQQISQYLNIPWLWSTAQRNIARPHAQVVMY